jgi:hypothetical protein
MSLAPPPYDPSESYGMFGYAGYVCEIALRHDNADLAEECWRRGWWDVTTRTLMGTVIEECDRRAPNVGARLRQLGPTQVEPEMAP